jgi:uncharacterized protein (TIGR02217 family)
MAFLETPRFPYLLALGVTGGPEFMTEVVTISSGFEQRPSIWTQSKQKWDASTAIRTLTDWQAIQDYFYVMMGRANGFRFLDPSDYTVSYSRGVVQPLMNGLFVGTPGLGYGVPTGQLAKKYSQGALSHYRSIRKPTAVNYQAQLDGSNVATTLDTTTGIVTYTATQSKAISTHTIGAAHVLHLASAFSPNFTNGQRVYITGVTGSAAALLNGLSHNISNVSGADLTLSTVTTGLTASGGTAYFYYQASNVLTWKGEFDVPVRFDIDHLQRQLITVGESGEILVQASSIPILEIRT